MTTCAILVRSRSGLRVEVSAACAILVRPRSALRVEVGVTTCAILVRPRSALRVEVGAACRSSAVDRQALLPIFKSVFLKSVYLTMRWSTV